MAELNDKGETAVVYFQPIQKLVELGNGHSYVFKVDRSISLAWIPESDLALVLDLRGGCCGNTTNRIFRVASASDVRLWSHTADR